MTRRRSNDLFDRLRKRAAKRLAAAGLHPSRLSDRVLQTFERNVRHGHAPNDIQVLLHPKDYAKLAPDIPAIRPELSELLAERCRVAGYKTVGRRRLHFGTDPAIPFDAERIIAKFTYEPTPEPEAPATSDERKKPHTEPASREPAEASATQHNQLMAGSDRYEDNEAASPPGHHVAVIALPGKDEAFAAGPLAYPTVAVSTTVHESPAMEDEPENLPGIALHLPGGEEIPVPHVPFSIGRVSDNDLVLVSFAVSRHHAELNRDDDGFILRDVGSRNGIVVDGQRQDEVRVVPGTVFTIGDIDLRLETRDG